MGKNNLNSSSGFNHKNHVKVLFAPLDWGLGHTTRIIPIIHECLAAGCDVILSGNKTQKALLQAEFPNLAFLDLPGYDVKYSQHHRFFLWKLFLQLPQLMAAIKKENKWLETIIKEHKLDLVISDNRYGLYHQKITSIIITHQLNISSPLGEKMNRLIQKMHYRFIEKFNVCWVPDQEDDGLGGELSHPAILPAIPMFYTGWLSRFREHLTGNKEKHLLVLLSGPEPQRTVFETMILNEIKTLKGKIIIVRGLPGDKEVLIPEPHVTVYNHVPANELNKLILEASYVIGRCGYSTVMDLARLKKKSILVPTPGQTEQEYLARFLSSQRFIYSVHQQDFSLVKSLEQARLFNYSFPTENPGQLNKLIHSTIKITSQNIKDTNPT